MDWGKLLKEYECKACIMSVEKFPNGGYGNIRIVAGNEAHKADVKMVTGHDFVNDTPYEMSFPKNLNFEDFCYRCAFLHEQLHGYVNLYEMGLWLDLYLLPLTSKEENKGYCFYAYNVAPRADAENMSDLSPETSSAVIATCIKLHGTEDFKQTINEVMEDVRQICGASRCSILMMDQENKRSYMLGDAVREGADVKRRGYFQRNFYKVASTWEDTLEGSTCLILKNERDMDLIRRKNPKWHASLLEANIDTIVLFPLKHNGHTLGYLWATNFDTENTVKIKEVLELTTFFLASEIANYQLVEQLKYISTMDQLTGVKNRNAMNNRIADFEKEDLPYISNLAVFFVDVNGLKEVNDSEGHENGDCLLKKAADVLREVFEEDVYRAGGDEFMVIVTDVTKEFLNQKLEALQKFNDDSAAVSFSVGCYFDETDLDVRKAMRLADELMYKDKEIYYKRHPERKHR